RSAGVTAGRGKEKVSPRPSIRNSRGVDAGKTAGTAAPGPKTRAPPRRPPGAGPPTAPPPKPPQGPGRPEYTMLNTRFHGCPPSFQLALLPESGQGTKFGQACRQCPSRRRGSPPPPIHRERP